MGALGDRLDVGVRARDREVGELGDCGPDTPTLDCSACQLYTAYILCTAVCARSLAGRPASDGPVLADADDLACEGSVPLLLHTMNHFSPMLWFFMYVWI